MRKVCPECQGAFEKQFLCPNCGVQLQDSADLAAAASSAKAEAKTELARAPELATRFFAGLVLAQGLFYAVELLLRAAQIATGRPLIPGSPAAVYVEMSLLASTALAGGIIAGAGNVRAVAAGIALGLFHAFAAIGAKFAFNQQPDEALLYGSLLVIPLLGGIAARIGRWLFPPLSDLYSTAPKSKERVVKAKAPPEPIAWFRIIGGAALSIGCTVWAGPIRDFVIGTSGGSFVVDSRMQSKFVTWVISALAMMVGGVFAGASTRSGFKHGFLVGFLACIGIFVIHSQVVSESLPAEKFFAAVCGLPETDALTPMRLALFLLTNALLLGVFGGWIGASLMPCVAEGPGRLDRGAI